MKLNQFLSALKKFICVSVCACIYIYVCIYMCIYIYFCFYQVMSWLGLLTTHLDIRLLYFHQPTLMHSDVVVLYVIPSCVTCVCSDYSLARDVVRNANIWVPPQIYRIKTFGNGVQQSVFLQVVQVVLIFWRLSFASPGTAGNL